jgi:hypothetical protein
MPGESGCGCVTGMATLGGGKANADLAGVALETLVPVTAERAHASGTPTASATTTTHQNGFLRFMQCLTGNTSNYSLPAGGRPTSKITDERREQGHDTRATLAASTEFRLAVRALIR